MEEEGEVERGWRGRGSREGVEEEGEVERGINNAVGNSLGILLECN